MPPRKKRGITRGRQPVRTNVLKIPIHRIPTSERDHEQVECRLCGEVCNFREFRHHNMEIHYNISTTTTDETVRDRRFFSRQLMELGKLAKIKIYYCPTPDCTTNYKSVLGLAFHLENCGKTAEEKEACLVECDLCHQKFSAPNMAWHKKSQHSDIFNNVVEEIEIMDITRETSKRQSAMKAREMLQKVQVTNAEEQDEEVSMKPARAFKFKSKIRKDSNWSELCEEKKGLSETATHDITYIASNFLDRNISDDFTSLRVYEDCLETIDYSNELTPPSQEKILEHLPTIERSIEFSVKHSELDRISTHYRRLKMFESESEDVDSTVILHTGGSVTSMAWHPSGKFFAVANLPGYKDHSDFNQKKTSIQIYEYVGSENVTTVQCEVNLLVVLAVDYGIVRHIQWSSYWPPNQKQFKVPEINIDSKLGYLAIACADSTCRIFAIYKSHFEMEQNFVTASSISISIYRKRPEVCLRVSDSLRANYVGECRNFEWHPHNRFLLAGYSCGHVALYDLQTTSKLLRSRKTFENDEEETIINPVWFIRAHHLPINGLCFADPVKARYFCTGGEDRSVKVYDTHLRMEVQGRKVGLITDMCWIQGWVHMAIALDSANTKSSSTHNYTRFYNLGTMQGRPNCAQLNSVTSISSQNGFTIESTEEGKVTATYFDVFWRECDYDRNKKRKNIVDLLYTKLDKASFSQFTTDTITRDHFMVTKDEEPRINIHLVNRRLESQTITEPSYDDVENLYRFYPYTRVNKVAWSPAGNQFIVGYRNGLVVIQPVCFRKGL